MQKKKALLFGLAAYELLRVFTLILLKLPHSAENLPVSWYAAVPLLIFPFLFTFFMDPQNPAAPVIKKLYALAKTMSVISLTAWVFSGIQTVRVFGFFSPAETKIYAVLLIFLLIDGILAITQAVSKSVTEEELPQ